MTNGSQSLPIDPALVHAYIDNELNSADALAVAQRIHADPALAAEIARTEALRNVLRERLPREPVPSHVRARIDAAVGLTRARTRPSWSALAASVAFAMVLASGTTFLAMHSPSDRGGVEALVDSHVRALMAPQPADIASSDRHTVKPWFLGRLVASPRVVDLAAEGFPLIGGRIDVVGAVPTPTLIYGRRKHIISLSAVPSSSGVESSPTRQSLKGYNVVVWRQPDVTYWAISDLNFGELETFAQKFRTAP